MNTHVTILGVLYIAFSCLGLLGALFVFTILTGSGLLSGDSEAFFITTGIGTVLAFLAVVFSVPGLIAGIGLLKKYSWARILALVLGFINLINIPIGTILGIYTIWVMLNEETVRLFARAS
jgi:hypothetical protein